MTLPTPIFEQFIEIHEPQLLAAGLPELYWRSLYEKLVNQIFDAGQFFEVLIEEGEQLDEPISSQVIALTDLEADDPKNVFLIDHAWTFRPNTARAALREVEGLKERLIEMLNIKMNNNPMASSDRSDDENGNDDGEGPCGSGSAGNGNGQPKNTDAEDARTEALILSEMWRHAQTYSIRFRDAEFDEKQIPVWYLPDEFGIRIGHSLQPNTKMVPFFNLFQNIAYSLLFPTKRILTREHVTRNFIDTQLAKKHPDWADVLLHPWQPADFSANPILHLKKTMEYFTIGRLHDMVPSQSLADSTKFAKTLDDPNICVCASDLQLIGNFRRLILQETNDPMSADIIWRRNHFHDFKALAEQNPGALINQFPHEAVLTVKDLFAATIQSAFEDGNGNALLDEQSLQWKPSWLPLTFNLDFELPQFVAYFQRREKKLEEQRRCAPLLAASYKKLKDFSRNLDNTWIVKPWNLARGMDVHVTRNLDEIIRLAESGPKIVSKYIENPVLFRRSDNGNIVKFDFRFIVFVRKLDEPMDIAVFNRFWIRFAINEFNLRNLDDQFVHITVHQYQDKSNVYEMKCEEFIEQLEKQYPKLRWPDVQAKINGVICQVFQAVTKNAPPRGIAPNRQSRAMFGFDLMLHWGNSCESVPMDQRGAEDVEVAFLEANFTPDCERACRYYDEFADIAFETMFFGKTDPQWVTQLF